MRIHHFPSTHSTQTGHGTIMGRVAQQLRAMGTVVGFLLRFSALSIIACLLVSAPLSPREVPYASHHPSPGH